jgi:hypothetical protein
MGCNCKKTKTPPPPTNKVVVKETKQIDNIVERLRQLMQ